jgi:hypothetical protein
MFVVIIAAVIFVTLGFALVVVVVWSSTEKISWIWEAKVCEADGCRWEVRHGAGLQLLCSGGRVAWVGFGDGAWFGEGALLGFVEGDSAVAAVK